MRDRLKKNLGLKCLSFLFAFLLWLVVVNIDNPITSKTFTNVPVSVEHAEILTEKQKTYQIVDDTQTVSVTVSAKRRELSRIKSEDISVIADMKELFMDSQIPLKVQIDGYEGTYENAVTNPRNLQIQIEDNISKTYNITPVATGEVRDGFVLGTIKTNPETVTINGPESLVGKISKVVAEVDVAGLSENETLDSELEFYDEDGEVIDHSRLGNNLGDYGVKVQIVLYQTKKVPVRVDVSELQIEEGYHISSVKITPEEIDVSGPSGALEKTESIQIPSSEFADHIINSKTEFTLDFTNYLPLDIQLADSMANSVVITITVEKDGTKNFELPVGSIAVKNLSDNFRLTYQNMEDLEVHVKGNSDILEKININKMTSIDLSEYKKAGSYTIPVMIELPEGCSLESEVEVTIILEEK